ncbi:MAG: hypothetical protein ACNA8W_07185 [Bradymonadaceae bacterium]
MIQPRIVGSLLGILLLFSLGCGPDDPVVPPPRPDISEIDAGPDGWIGPEEDSSNNPNNGHPLGCEPNRELGMLSVGYNQVFDGEQIARVDSPATNCYAGDEDSGVWLMTFEVDEEVIVKLSVRSPGDDHPVYQLNKGECLAEEGEFCRQDSGNYRFLAQAGSTYYLWIEKPHLVNDLTFLVDIGIEEFVCWPGELACAGGDVEICHMGQEWRPVGACVTDCRDESSCVGDICEDAITVELSATGPVANRAKTFVGDRHAFSNQWTAEDRPGCDLQKQSLEEGEEDIGFPTEDGEVFFRVPNLKGGQTLSVKAVNQTGNYGFFILGECGAESCLDAASQDANYDRRLEWEVPADGTYIVVIESLGAQARDFEFVFELSN